MTDSTTNQELEGESNVGEDQPDVSQLQAEIDRLTAEAAKYRNKNKMLLAETVELKKKQPETSQEEDYKKLFAEEKAQRENLMAKLRQVAIEGAVKANLAKLSVKPDAFDAAVKLIDNQLIEWDADTGLDTISMDAAIKKLKNQHSFLFETTVPSVPPKSPSDPSVKSKKTMTRAEFDNLPQLEKAAAAKNYTLIN
jgi:hypothetical protein